MGKVPLRPYICSKHFVAKDFLSPKKNRVTAYRTLKACAIPSVQLPKRFFRQSPSLKKKKENEERERRNARSQLQFCTAPRTLQEEMNYNISEHDIDEPRFIDNSGNIKPSLTSVWSILSVDVACQVHPISSDKDCQVNTIDFLQTNDTKPTILEILTNDRSMEACAGLTSVTQFNKLCESVEYVMTTLHVNSKRQLDVRAQVLLTLMKLKLNTTFKCLSCFFNICERSAREIFFYMVDVLYIILKHFVVWFPKDVIQDNMPIYFAVFTDTRVVLDCAETPVQQTKCLNCSIRTYSHYKGRHNIKFMIGVAPSGCITFLSKAYGGRASDKHIFNDSKILDLCQIGDAVMVDKGFAIEDECGLADIKLYRPPFFYKKNKQFNPEEVRKYRLFARARVHVERVIQRLRLFKILTHQVDWIFLEVIDKIPTIGCALVNLSKPVLTDERF